MAIEVNTIVDCCQISSVIDVKADLKFIDNRHNRYQTFVGNLYSSNEDHGSIIHGMALKIAESGLSYNDLLALWKKFGEPGVVGIPSMPPYEYTIVRNVERPIKVAQESRKTSGFFQILLNTLNKIMFQIHPIVVGRKFKYPVRFSM